MSEVKREAQTLGCLQHPNIVRFYVLEETGELAFMPGRRISTLLSPAAQHLRLECLPHRPAIDIGGVWDAQRP
jgi:hypothetical protein